MAQVDESSRTLSVDIGGSGIKAIVLDQREIQSLNAIESPHPNPLNRMLSLTRSQN